MSCHEKLVSLQRFRKLIVKLKIFTVMQDQGINPAAPQNEMVEEQALEPVENESPVTSNEKNWFEIVYNSVLGFFAAIAVILFSLFLLAGLGYWCYEGYCRWFSTEGMYEVGDNGYYYDMEHQCFVKPMPNRCVLEGCINLESNEDSIGVACFGKNDYRYINLNTLSFLNDHSYYRAELFRDGRALALAKDTLYVISTDGKTIKEESSTWIYSSIEEITYSQYQEDSDGYGYYKEISTGMYVYEDAYHHYGLMSNGFVKLTEPIFSDITARSEEVFFAEYIDSGLGILINKKGQILK